MGLCAYSPGSVLGRGLAGTCAGRTHAATVSESIYASVLLGLENTISLESYITGSYNLSASSSAWIPEPRGEGYDKYIPFRDEYFHSLQLFSCGCLGQLLCTVRESF